jgi:molybdate-binding protein
VASPEGVVGVVGADRETALGLLRSGAVLAAGYHGGAAPPRVAGGRLARLHVVRREVGLVAARGRVPRLEDLATATLASRAPSSGIRRTLDRALAAAGLDPNGIHLRAHLCPSHLDVVTRVARGDVDLGVATHAWAHRLGLPFAALETEDYGLLFRADQLGRPEVVQLCEAAQGASLRRALEAEAGYDARATGTLSFDPEPPVAAPA